MSKSFVPGTTSNKTVKEIDDLIVAGLRSKKRIAAKSVKPAFVLNDDGSLALDDDGMPTIAGYQIVHAEPTQRKPRADKGKPRKDATSTTAKAS